MPNIDTILQKQVTCQGLPSDSIAALAEGYLERTLTNLDMAANDAEIGKVAAKYIAVLKRYVECKYCPGFPDKSFQEIAIEQNIRVRETVFNGYLRDIVFVPFRTVAGGLSRTEDKELVKELSGVLHAVNGHTLRERIGTCGEKTFQFCLDVFGLEMINYHFESFRDQQLEVLYSNDGINLSSAAVHSYVNRFFRFFIDGDALKNEPYKPERYYGCIPVSESRILRYCKEQRIPSPETAKLMCIIKCSGRFERETHNDELYYSLKVQYLNNKYAMCVAILFREGQPLHKEVLHSRIQTLHSQYPRLVGDHSLESFVLRGSSRAKPILCSASVQGEWKLQIWSEQRDILQDIRDYVAEVYNKTKLPVPFEDIVSKMSSLGHTYGERSLRTYVTRSGCISRRGLGYVPQGCTGDVRFWYGKLYLVQRYAASCLLEKGRAATRKEIMDYITNCGHPVNVATLDRALRGRPDLFSVLGDSKRNQRIILSELICGKRDVNRVIPEPEKREPDYVKAVRLKMVDYLLSHKEENQKNLTDIFKHDIPDHIQESRSIIRKVLTDEEIFLKRTDNRTVFVSLQHAYRARLEQARPVVDNAVEIQKEEIHFSWDGLKEGIMRQILKDSVDPSMSNALDNVFRVFRCGETEMPLNSTFNGLIKPLYKYVSSQTSAEERWDLQVKILQFMEAYLREFHTLKYGDPLDDIRGFGPLKIQFQDEGILPDRNRCYLPQDELTLCRIVDSVNTQRNKVVGHPAPLSEQSDRQAIKGIHDCLSVMVYLGKKL